MSGEGILPPRPFGMRSQGVRADVVLHRCDRRGWLVDLMLGGGADGALSLRQELTPVAAIELGRALMRFGELAERPGTLPENSA